MDNYRYILQWLIIWLCFPVIENSWTLIKI
jgi:hypothetical protein